MNRWDKRTSCGTITNKWIQTILKTQCKRQRRIKIIELKEDLGLKGQRKLMVLHAKHGRNVLFNQKYMGPINRTKYLKNNASFLQSNKTRTIITTQKNILYHNDLLRKCLIWILADGKSINFWYDSWMKDSLLVDKINLNIRQYIEKNAKLSDFISPTKYLHINSLVNNKIKAIALPISDLKDRIR